MTGEDWAQVGRASVLDVPMVADSVANPRLVYGSMDLRSADGWDQAYHALYFEVAHSADLGRVTFEGLDAVRAARGEHLPYDDDDAKRWQDWVFTVEDASWLPERHAYENRWYATPLLETHRHYLFTFHDVFVEAIAEGIWFDIADRADPFAPPAGHPLSPLSPDLPAEEFTSAAGVTWWLRRSPRTDAELIEASRYCSQRVYQFSLDGDGREAASIWVRTTNGALVSRLTQPWPVPELARIDGFASPGDVAEQWETYLRGVAQRRRDLGGRS